MDIKTLTKLFEKYYSYPDTQHDFSSNELSILFTNLNKLEKYIESVINNNAYSSPYLDVLFNVFSKAFASVRSIIDINKPSADIRLLSEESIDNLLSSFGFDYLSLPLDTKRKLLSELVSLYKIKGTLSSIENALKAIYTGTVIVSEMYLEKVGNDVKFTVPINLPIPGSTDSQSISLSYENVVDGKWFLSKEDILNDPISKRMSPYFTVGVVDKAASDFISILKIKLLIKNQYEALMKGDLSTYNSYRVFNLDTLPQSMTLLELWYLHIYLYCKLNNIDLSNNSHSKAWFYTKSSFIQDLKDDVTKQFDIRYDIWFKDVFLAHQVLIGDFIDNKHIYTTPSGDLYRYKDNRQNVNYIYLQPNRIAILFGKINDKESYTLTILEPGQPARNYYIDLWLDNPFIISDDYNIIVFGGKTYSGTDNDKLYIINTKKMKVYESSVNFDLSQYTKAYKYYFDPFTKRIYLFYLDDVGDTLLYYVNSLTDEPIYVETISHKVEQVISSPYYLFLLTEENQVYRVKKSTHETDQLCVIPKEITNFLVLPLGQTIILYDLNSNKEFLYDSGSRIFVETNSLSSDITSSSIQNRHVYVLSDRILALVDNNTCDIIYYINRLHDNDFRVKTDNPVSISDCDSARCFRDKMLKERYTYLVQDENQTGLPYFNNLQELRNFLEQLVPQNIKEIDMAPDKNRILFEILTVLSGIEPGSNYISVMNTYEFGMISKFVEYFKPVYSRLFLAKFLANIVDPIGDWVALSDRSSINDVRIQNEHLTLTDDTKLAAFKRYFSSLSLQDKILFEIHYKNLQLLIATVTGLNQQYITVVKEDELPGYAFHHVVLPTVTGLNQQYITSAKEDELPGYVFHDSASIATGINQQYITIESG